MNVVLCKPENLEARRAFNADMILELVRKAP